jgi:uncharacterized protein (TIGR00299 family) protein
VFAYLDCFSGISGDKFLGALLDAGLDQSVLREQLALLGLDGFELVITPARRAGLPGTAIDVRVAEGQRARDWRTIRELVRGSGLPPRTRERALAIFGTLAEAEAAVHGVPVDDVHFHEVGAVDSIVDIVGAAIGVVELGIDEIWSSPVRLGRGTVMTSHGELPVPAPATAALLRGVPVYAGDLEGEMTTPTGAAILSAIVGRFAPLPPMRVAAEGWGAGSRELPIANLLRITIGEREPGDLEEVAVLESALDHVTPELLAATIDLLLEDGALDAWAEPVSMKKRRLGSEVTVVARPEDAERLSESLMRHTGTLGVRRTHTWREVAPRRLETVQTSLGRIRVKVQGAGASLRARPENDDVVAVARRTGLPLEKVARTLTQEAEAALGAGDAAEAASD